MKVITHLGMGDVQPGETVDLSDEEAKRLLRLGAASLPGSKKSSARDEQDQAEKADTTSKSDKNKE